MSEARGAGVVTALGRQFSAPPSVRARTPCTGRTMDDGLLPNGYKLVERIGCGGFGEVWRAEAPGGFEVAVKVLFRSVDHEEGRRELQALEVIRRLRHPFLLATQAYWVRG